MSVETDPDLMRLRAMWAGLLTEQLMDAALSGQRSRVRALVASTLRDAIHMGREEVATAALLWSGAGQLGPEARLALLELRDEIRKLNARERREAA